MLQEPETERATLQAMTMIVAKAMMVAVMETRL